jgi:hypothetical protein
MQKYNYMRENKEKLGKRSNNGANDRKQPKTTAKARKTVVVARPT